MRRAGQVLLLSGAIALATIVFGWVTVPVLAFAWGVVASDSKPGAVSGMAAGLGWGWLLLWTAAVGPAGELASRAGGVLSIPSVALVMVTLLFPMVLAWGGGVVGCVVASVAKRD